MLDPNQIRPHFPALARTQNGKPLVYFDGPGGTQVTRSCLDAMTDYLTRCNANHGGLFITGIESDAIVHAAHEAMADFLNTHDAGEVIFGQNMTTLTFAMSRTLGQTFEPGDEIILTVMDHDANYSPWALMARDRGLTVHVVDIDPADCTLKLSDFERYLNSRTRLVAVGYASNSSGTINPVKQIISMAHAAGALTYIDAVHYASHGPIDVQDLDTDFLACSPYKFFAPHMGALYGKRPLLEALPAYKVRPADSHLPHKFEAGTLSHESLAGLVGTMQYLDWLGRTYGEAQPGKFRSARAATLHAAMHATQAYESGLKAHMLEGLTSLKRVKLYGVTDPARLDERVGTFVIRVEGMHPDDTARYLAQRGICVWSGNYYAMNLSERLGVEDSGGMVRIGLAHYNTIEEVDRLLADLHEIAA